MPRICCVDGCYTQEGAQISLFHCPKDESRCQRWKQALGFVNSHRYANRTPEQVKKLIVCELHFPEGSFIQKNVRKHLLYNAVPSLNLLKNSEATTPKDVAIQTNIEEVSPNNIKDNINMQDVFVQTEAENEFCADASVQACTYSRDKYTQTSALLSANSPRKNILKRKLKMLEKDMASPAKCSKQLETGITLEDVHRYLEENYPKQSSTLLKNQLNLLNKSAKGWPKAYKQISTMYRLPSKSTLNRFTRKWVINPGFNDFIFRLLELRAKIMNEKERDCIICLDEVSLKSHFFYDITRDKIIGFQEGNNTNSSKVATSALVVMARGIASSWKQPIAYFFYNSTAPSEEIKEVLFESVKKLNQVKIYYLHILVKSFLINIF